ncbi:hypothetical protein PFISCL1PPCAC_10110, partial [Pristionchus fissidentatus]
VLQGQECRYLSFGSNRMASEEILALLKVLNLSKESSLDEVQVMKLHHLLQDKVVPFHSRLMAAQILSNRSESGSSCETPALIASLKNRTPQELSQFLSTWCDYVKREGYPTQRDGYELFYHLLKDLSKLKDASFSKERRDTVLFASLYYSEVNPGKDSAKCLPLFLKTFLRADIDRHEVFILLLFEISPGVKSKYDLLASIIQLDSSVLNAENQSIILTELANVAKSQEGSSTCVVLLSMVLQTLKPDEIIDWFIDVVTTTEKSTRNNVHRSWICRLSAIPALHSILDRTLTRCRDKFGSLVDPIDFPPLENEIHEWTCIDPYERWEEDEDVYWSSDALLSTILLIFSLRQKGTMDDGWKDLLLRASKWHLEEIRLTALQLLQRFSILSVDEKIDVVLRNLTVDDENFMKEIGRIKLDCEGKRREEVIEIVERYSKEGHKIALQSLLQLDDSRGRSVVGDLLLSIDSEERRMAYGMIGAELNETEKRRIMDELSSTSTVDERTIDYLGWMMKGSAEDAAVVEKMIIDWRTGGVRDWIKCAHFVSSSQLSSILDENLNRIDELLVVSGSNSISECPSFTEFYEKIRKAGMEPKQYSDEMLSRLSLLDHSSRLELMCGEKALRVVFEAILRCRYKAVVDQGASIFETLLRRQPTLAAKYAEEILSLLSLDSTECRSLSLSRCLLSCSLVDSSLIRSIESSFLTVYSTSPLHTRPSLIRWMKTLKLMTAKANETKISDSFLENLFFICIDLQYLSTDFLERSAAMCLYSFCILKMVGPTGCSLFSLLAHRPEFVDRLFDLVEKLPSLPRIVSILIFSFLSKLDYVSDRFYGDKWADRLDIGRSTIWSLLLLSGLKRERRFIVDAFLSLTPHSERRRMRDRLKEECGSEEKEDGLRYLKESLIPREMPSAEVVDARLDCSLYWRKIKEALAEESCSPLLEMKLSYEQAALAVGLGLGLMGRRLSEEKKEEERERAEEILRRLSGHERRRVRGVAARGRDEWNGERRREERGAVPYL